MVLSALVHGPDHDSNPNYASIQSCESTCQRHGLRLLAASGEPALDVRHPNFINPDAKTKIVYNHYFNTIEFLAEKPGR